LHLIWPEYEEFFKDPFYVTSRLRHQPKAIVRSTNPYRHLEYGSNREELSEVIRKAPRGKHAQAQAKKVWHAATNSASMHRSLDGACIYHEVAPINPEESSLVKEQNYKISYFIFDCL